MRSALWCALLCGVGMSAAAQERAVTFEEPPPVSVTGFAVGRADYDRVTRSNTFTAGKIGVSLFKPVVSCPNRYASPTGLNRLTPILRSEEHTSELQSRQYLVCRLLLEK